jgi:hypothetical protein
MPNSTSVVRESPRLGKGVNKRFTDSDGLQKVPKKKTKPSPLEEANKEAAPNATAPNADDSPATTTDEKALSVNRHYQALNAKAAVWEKEDLQKVKKTLVTELVQVKKNEFTLAFNCQVWEQSQKKTVKNFKAYKAKVEPQLKELRQFRAQMGGNAEQYQTLQDELEFVKAELNKTKEELILAEAKSDTLEMMAKKAKSEASAYRVRAVLPGKSRETCPPNCLGLHHKHVQDRRMGCGEVHPESQGPLQLLQVGHCLGRYSQEPHCY